MDKSLVYFNITDENVSDLVVGKYIIPTKDYQFFMRISDYIAFDLNNYHIVIYNNAPTFMVIDEERERTVKQQLGLLKTDMELFDEYKAKKQELEDLAGFLKVGE